VGSQPFWGLSVLLPEAVGVRNAKYMSATGNFVGAEQAQKMGLVTSVVAHEDLLSTALDFAGEVVSNDADALRVLMGGYEESVGLSQEDATKAEHRRAIAWQTWHYDSSKMAERRQTLTKRGSSQVAEKPSTAVTDKDSP
jgi:enoyl-CoA hydratase